MEAAEPKYEMEAGALVIVQSIRLASLEPTPIFLQMELGASEMTTLDYRLDWSPTSDRRRGELSSSCQPVKLRASRARCLACFVNCTGEALGEALIGRGSRPAAIALIGRRAHQGALR
jgi:hypothetical protein